MMLAIDYGTKKIGLAFSDPTLNFVSRTLTIKYKSIKEAIKTIKYKFDLRYKTVYGDNSRLTRSGLKE